jgi:choline kinase
MIAQMAPLRKALLLAAGYGSRLSSAQSLPKPLTPLAGEPSIVRLIRQFHDAGISEVAVVVGHRGDEVRAAVERGVAPGVRLTFFENHRYAEPNGLSVLAARDFVDERVLLSMSDHLFVGGCVGQMARLDREGDETVLLIDRNISGVFDLDDATKVLTDDAGGVLEIGKELERYNAIDTGLFCISPALVEALSGLESPSLSQGVKKLATRGLMWTRELVDGEWQDIDTFETLTHALKLLER